MTHDDIEKQSKQAYRQQCVFWRKNAAFHKKYKMKSFEDFRNTGIGKTALLVANGYSFEENIETIKKYKDNIDVICCDKTLGHLLDNGITPYICMVCDAHVSYEKYLKPYEDRLNNTILFNNVCGNVEWSSNGNWKDLYFYVNKDVMHYENEFIELSGCKNIVTAGTNISNMMVVLLVQSDNERKQNLFSYDKLALIGFDYSWKAEGKYYAFDHLANGKFYYMKHIYGLSLSNNLIYSSNNLSSSAAWLNLYVKAFKVPVVQCGKDSLANFNRQGDLEKSLQYRHKTSDADVVKRLLDNKIKIEIELKKIQNDIAVIARDHWLTEMATV
jgi:hypothetical protein